MRMYTNLVVEKHGPKGRMLVKKQSISGIGTKQHFRYEFLKRIFSISHRPAVKQILKLHFAVESIAQISVLPTSQSST